jgi:hypothetical protein
MSRFDGLHELTTAEIGRFMIRRGRRGESVAVALVAGMYQVLAEHYRADVMFASCPPGLVRRYLALGLRLYDGRLVSTPDGVEVPLIAIFSDRTYPAPAGSSLVPFIDELFGQGRRRRLPPAAFAELLDPDHAPLQLRPDAVRRILLEHRARSCNSGHGFLRRLTTETIERVAERAITIRVPAGALLSAKGLLSREVYIVLEGAVEARGDGRRPASVGAGRAIGTASFFGSSGRRRASIYAATDTELLILRRCVVDELRERHPACAAEILVELARALADDNDDRRC